MHLLDLNRSDAEMEIQRNWIKGMGLDKNANTSGFV